MISCVDKCIKGMCPVYLNDLFEINSGNSSQRLNMLKQPKHKKDSWDNGNPARLHISPFCDM